MCLFSRLHEQSGLLYKFNEYCMTSNFVSVDQIHATCFVASCSLLTEKTDTFFHTRWFWLLVDLQRSVAVCKQGFRGVHNVSLYSEVLSNLSSEKYKNRNSELISINYLESVFVLFSFVIKQTSDSTNYEQSDIIKVSDWKFAISFEHGSSNSA